MGFMGQLIDGKWRDDSVAPNDKFTRAEPMFRNWVTRDGSTGPTGKDGFKAESGRYHLYVSYACPWAHRTLIYRAMKGLQKHISVNVVHPEALDKGWSFNSDFRGATGDQLMAKAYLYEVYQASDPQVTCRSTVPILWDRQRHEIVSNESSEIIRMFNTAFNAVAQNDDDYYPTALRDDIDELNTRVYDTLNNGVYRCGFARTQDAYDEAVTELFDTMDYLESRLQSQRFLLGDRLTEADLRLFPTLVRFDPVYNGHFKCNIKRLVDYPALWDYTRAIYQIPAIRDTVAFDHIKRHYYFSHESINPKRIVPSGPVIDFDAPSSRT